MSLPKIEAPTFTMNLTSIQKPITYRPFLVKEEKLLLMAMEGGDQEEIIRTSKQIINNGKDLFNRNFEYKKINRAKQLRILP